MATINRLVDRFAAERPVGSLLDDFVILAQAIAAVNFYSGYANLQAHLDIPVADPTPVQPTLATSIYSNYYTEPYVYFGPVVADPIPAPLVPYPDISGETDITFSEWALIRPLFLLYVERENAYQLEASRGFGIDPYGRSSSEVIADITQMELGWPHAVAYSPIITI